MGNVFVLTAGWTPSATVWRHLRHAVCSSWKVQPCCGQMNTNRPDSLISRITWTLSALNSGSFVNTEHDLTIVYFIMLGSILSFSPELAEQVSEYCEKNSTNIPPMMHSHWGFTTEAFGDADKMSSKLQAQFFIWLAQLLNPTRILEIGCYSGFSAMAWYEGTRKNKATITTLEINSEMIRASRDLFGRANINDRITLIEGPAHQSIDSLIEPFDLIFVDANKDGYESYVRQILDRKLLTPHGTILCDNGKQACKSGYTALTMQ